MELKQMEKGNPGEIASEAMRACLLGDPCCWYSSQSRQIERCFASRFDDIHLHHRLRVDQFSRNDRTHAYVSRPCFHLETLPDRDYWPRSQSRGSRHDGRNPLTSTHPHITIAVNKPQTLLHGLSTLRSTFRTTRCPTLATFLGRLCTFDGCHGPRGSIGLVVEMTFAYSDTTL